MKHSINITKYLSDPSQGGCGLLHLSAHRRASHRNLLFAILSVLATVPSRSRSSYFLHPKTGAFKLPSPSHRRLGSPYSSSTVRSLCITLPIHSKPYAGISEWYCPVTPGTGLHPRPSSADGLQSFFPGLLDDSWSSIWYPSRKGEDVDEIYARTDGFLEAFVPEVEKRMPSTHARVLLVSHAAIVIALTRELLADKELPLRIGCCTLTDLRRKQNAPILGGWTSKLLASGDHLAEGIQRDWGFEDIVISDGKVCCCKCICFECGELTAT